MDRRAQLRRLGLFDARVPRYTSYPTANHFTDRIDSETVAGWMGQIPEGSAVSLYIHIPFCRRLCWFCACRTQGTKSGAPVAAYVERVKEELALLAQQLPQDIHLSRLHWGGGTPSILTPEQIRSLSESIFEVTPLGEGAEFSVEIDPNEFDEARRDAFHAAGMNRASIGVQDFHSEVQGLIGREQTFDRTREVIDSLRDVGIESVNIDILYGLPAQTAPRITDTILKVLSLSPDRIALYGYAHVPWMARRQALIPSDRLPAPDERLALFETAEQLIRWDGYRSIGIDHFARDADNLAQAAVGNGLRRNFQGYTDDSAKALIGLGASSISRYPQGYAQNAASTASYATAVAEGELPIARGHEFKGDDLLRGDIIESLMCYHEVSISKLARANGYKPEAISAVLDSMDEAFRPYVERDTDVLRIKPEAVPLTRMIARTFDAYAMSEQGHSPAI